MERRKKKRTKALRVSIKDVRSFNRRGKAGTPNPLKKCVL